MKIKLNAGLKLDKQSLSKLQDSQMANLKGGKSTAEDPIVITPGTSGPRCTCRRNSCQGNDPVL